MTDVAMPFTLRFVKRFRRLATWLVALAALGLLVVSTSAWPDGGVMDIVLGDVGLILLVVCAFGRVWSSIFIAGYKNDRLIVDGPYSLVRNPLYVFSFCGAVGLGLSAESLTITGLLILPFVVWYPILVVEEERFLADRHGSAWQAYVLATPRFFPAIRYPTQPAAYTINTRQVGRAFMDAIWFPIAALGLQALEMLHQNGTLPTFYRFW
jgi:protein-S-isoprenylcysteine O-methyltransferase Ste14